MVKVKTFFGTFDTQTREATKVIPSRRTALGNFSLITKPPRIIPIPRFGGQKAVEAKKNPASMEGIVQSITTRLNTGEFISFEKFTKTSTGKPITLKTFKVK